MQASFTLRYNLLLVVYVQVVQYYLTPITSNRISYCALVFTFIVSLFTFTQSLIRKW